ncbi:MAG: hypothetical protein JWO91_2515, partial [Acidobacteriaceae bacterium]|nr:hypothetical protein [Acidobacteriaceae bacterium]
IRYRCEKSFFDHIARIMLTHEDDVREGRDCTDAAGSFDAVNPRQADVEKNYIREMFLSFRVASSPFAVSQTMSKPGAEDKMRPTPIRTM